MVGGHHYSPETKMESILWEHSISLVKEKFKTSVGAGKFILVNFKLHGVVMAAVFSHLMATI
jgi:hypothetical protein